MVAIELRPGFKSRDKQIQQTTLKVSRCNTYLPRSKSMNFKFEKINFWEMAKKVKNCIFSSQVKSEVSFTAAADFLLTKI